MKKMIAGLFALVFMTIASVAYAQDADIEFGVADDLTVEGITGDFDDADVEIDGFMVIGSTTGNDTVLTGSGNLWIEKGIEAEGISYFGSSINVTGYGVFLSTVEIGANALKLGNGSLGQVLLSNDAGFAYWGSVPGGVLSGGNAGYISYWTDGITLSFTKFHRDLDTSYTFIGSSVTVGGLFLATGEASLDGGIDVNGGNFTVATGGGIDTVSTLDVDGLASLDGGINVLDLFVVGASGNLTIGNSTDFTVTAAGGAIHTDGTLDVDGNTTLNAQLDVDGLAVFNSSASVMGNLGVGKSYDNGYTMDVKTIGTDVALRVEGSGSTGVYAAKFYAGSAASEANLAAWIKKK